MVQYSKVHCELFIKNSIKDCVSIWNNSGEENSVDMTHGEIIGVESGISICCHLALRFPGNLKLEILVIFKTENQKNRAVYTTASVAWGGQGQ